MLDTNTVENTEEDRDITSALYGATEMRLKRKSSWGSAGSGFAQDGLSAGRFLMNEGAFRSGHPGKSPADGKGETRFAEAGKRCSDQYF
jgi:hypothetical protein